MSTWRSDLMAYHKRCYDLGHLVRSILVSGMSTMRDHLHFEFALFVGDAERRIQAVSAGQQHQPRHFQIQKALVHILEPARPESLCFLNVEAPFVAGKTKNLQ